MVLDKNFNLSVIIPCYNEENNLKKGVLEKVYKYMRNQNFSWEVIVSDDGSSDNSRDLIKSQIKSWENFRLLENPHGSKPSALWYGIKAAVGSYVLFADMDQSTPISELEKLLPFVDKKVGAVIGSRGFARKNRGSRRNLAGGFSCCVTAFDKSEAVSYEPAS